MFAEILLALRSAVTGPEQRNIDAAAVRRRWPHRSFFDN